MHIHTHSYPDMFENLWKDYQNKIAVQKFPLPKKKWFLTMKLHRLLKFTKIIQCNDSLLHVNCIMNLSLLL